MLVCKFIARLLHPSLSSKSKHVPAEISDAPEFEFCPLPEVRAASGGSGGSDFLIVGSGGSGCEPFVGVYLQVSPPEGINHMFYKGDGYIRLLPGEQAHITFIMRDGSHWWRLGRREIASPFYSLVYCSSVNIEE